MSAFENGRANPFSLLGWCDNKRRFPTWKVLRRDALGGVIGDLDLTPRNSSVGEVLAGWGLELVRVTYGAEVPV